MSAEVDGEMTDQRIMTVRPATKPLMIEQACTLFFRPRAPTSGAIFEAVESRDDTLYSAPRAEIAVNAQSRRWVTASYWHSLALSDQYTNGGRP
jgi:hypothetical protein